MNLILEFNFSTNLMIEDSKEGIVKAISWVIVSDLWAILEFDCFASKNMEGNAVQMGFSWETWVATELIKFIWAFN
jgi:hypothetical protein